MAIKTVNPVDGQLNKEFAAHSDFQITEILKSTKLAQTHWKDEALFRRAQFLQAAATILNENEAALAAIMTLEMGKPMKEARAEIKKSAWVCEFYAQNAENFLSTEGIPADVKKSYLTYEPLGVVLAVMPWNFPFWQVFRAAAPALTAGNGMILKHASNVPQCALAIEKVFQEAGFPEGIFQTALVGSSSVASMIESAEIAAVTLTGSTPAGREVAALAGRNLKKCVLELGGSDPYLILKDADLEFAADQCIAARLLNNGQSCISAKRLIAVKEIHDEFESIILEKLKNKKFSDPTLEETELGPMARVDLRDELHEQVENSVNSGARLLLGGEIPDEKMLLENLFLQNTHKKAGLNPEISIEDKASKIKNFSKGAWYPVTFLSGVKKGMAAFDEELFGPVVTLIQADSEAHAIELANDTPFGLGAAVFSCDEARAEDIARTKLNAGSCFVNSFVKSDPRLPFGGIKDSGFGRELSRLGMHEFVNIKTVSVS